MNIHWQLGLQLQHNQLCSLRCLPYFFLVIMHFLVQFSFLFFRFVFVIVFWYLFVLVLVFINETFTFALMTIFIFVNWKNIADNMG